MTRDDAIGRATATFDVGGFLGLLREAVAYPTESQAPGQEVALHAYLDAFIAPLVSRLGFEIPKKFDNPDGVHGPFLIARRHEAENLPTVLIYGHGDTVRGYPEQWRDGLKPWEIVVEGDRWYGRGTADNKGQHVLNLAALEQVIAARG